MDRIWCQRKVFKDDLRGTELRHWYKKRSVWEGSGVGAEMMHRIYGGLGLEAIPHAAGSKDNSLVKTALRLGLRSASALYMVGGFRCLCFQRFERAGAADFSPCSLTSWFCPGLRGDQLFPALASYLLHSRVALQCVTTLPLLLATVCHCCWEIAMFNQIPSNLDTYHWPATKRASQVFTVDKEIYTIREMRLGVWYYNWTLAPTLLFM